MADTQSAGTLVLATSREELMVQHAEARKRRMAAVGGSHEWEQASHDVARIEIEIARIEREMDPPLV